MSVGPHKIPSRTTKFKPSDMLKESVLAEAIQSCARTANLRRGKHLHAHLLSASPRGTPTTFLSNHLLNMYSKCRDIASASILFDRMPHRNRATWTALITGLSHNKNFAQATEAFSLMHSCSINPTPFALSSTIQALASAKRLRPGMQVHALSVKCGLDLELFVGSNLSDMYSKCGSLSDASQVFETMTHKDEVSWNAMIDGYAKRGDHERAFVVFSEMLREGAVAVDRHVVCTVLAACGGMKGGWQGRSVHSVVLKLGFGLEEALGNALTDMYSKIGDVECASDLVNTGLVGWNVVSSSCLIDGYVKMDQVDKALVTFNESRRLRVDPNEYTFSSLIKGCAGQAALEQGIQLHAQVVKTGFVVFDPLVSALLVDMYGKCGLFNCSIELFKEVKNPCNIAWNSMIGILAQHGRGKEAIGYFNQMIFEGLEPNNVTFVSLLMACSHSGMVDQGLEYFDSMQRVYGIEPREEHYSCVIDMLGRAGRLREAQEFIGRMPMEPNAYGWCSLLGACKIHGAKDLGELAAEKLMRLEPENSALHVLLSNIYASSGQWEDVKAVRKLMRDSGLKKLPGLSWVDIDNKTHLFGAEDWSAPQHEEIYKKLEALTLRIKEEGYIPLTSLVNSNVEEKWKEKMLQHHSERIAVAFALIRTPASKPIIVKKNLRVCIDCHSAIKLISKVEGREIILRDGARFHHFADGLCSCGDYW